MGIPGEMMEEVVETTEEMTGEGKKATRVIQEIIQEGLETVQEMQEILKSKLKP